MIEPNPSVKESERDAVEDLAIKTKSRRRNFEARPLTQCRKRSLVVVALRACHAPADEIFAPEDAVFPRVP
jgi:hypothetical protein